MRRPFGILRNLLVYRIFVWMLRNLPFAIPVKRLRETKTLLAFFHPRPAYPFHVIILPRGETASLVDLNPADPFLVDLVIAAQSLVAEYKLSAYRLVVNGGEYQEFPHLHFHLVSDMLPSLPHLPPKRMDVD